MNNLGVALKRKGDLGAARFMYRDALGSIPGWPRHFNLGEIRAGWGIQRGDQPLPAGPAGRSRFARAHHLLGVALLAKGRCDEVDD